MFILQPPFKQMLAVLWAHKLKSLGILGLTFLLMTFFDNVGQLITQGLFYLTKIPQQTLTNDLNLQATIHQLPLPLIIWTLGIVGPLVEELIYRYLLINFLKRYVSANWAIIFASLCFALIHIGSFNLSNFFSILPYFMSGLVFGYTYHKTNNILFSSIVHIFNNTSVFLLS